MGEPFLLIEKGSQIGLSRSLFGERRSVSASPSCQGLGRPDFGLARGAVIADFPQATKEANGIDCTPNGGVQAPAIGRTGLSGMCWRFLPNQPRTSLSQVLRPTAGGF